MFNRKASTKTSIEPQDIRLEICPSCQTPLTPGDLIQENHVCPKCSHHFTQGAYDRLNALLDDDSFKEIYGKAHSRGLNKFPDYDSKLSRYQSTTQLNEAVICGFGKINKQRIAIAVMDSRFMMGSMGQVVGEKITRLIEHANRKDLPLFIFTASGGARMQEGILSLFQMAKTAAALERFNQKGGFYTVILTHPTTGGVSASFAMLGDVILAEPKALIGFAGRRVIEKTVKEQLPDDFQKAEFLKEKGFVDAIVDRRQHRTVLSNLIQLHHKVVL